MIEDNANCVILSEIINDTLYITHNNIPAFTNPLARICKRSYYLLDNDDKNLLFDRNTQLKMELCFLPAVNLQMYRYSMSLVQL